MTTLYVQSPTLYQASSGNIVGATSITLTSLTDIYGNVLTMSDFGGLGYFTCEPDTTNSEGGTFTGVTANANGTYTLTGVKTMLAKSPYTQTSGLVRQHSGGTKVVITDNVGFWDTFLNKNNDSTVLGKITLTSTQKMIYDANPTLTDDKEVATKKYVDDVAIAGSPEATTAVKGIVQLPTQAQVLSKTATGSTGAALAVTPDVMASTLLSDYKADTGAANAYVITPSPAITAYTAGQIFSFKAINANTTTSTLNVNGLGVKTIVKTDATTVLVANDIKAGSLCLVEYDGTNFQLISSVANIPLLPTGDGSLLTNLPPVSYVTTASDNLKLSADTERTQASSFAGVAYSLQKSFQLINNGTIRLKMETKDASASGGDARVYRNGVYISPSHAGGTTYTAYSDDITGNAAGDFIQVYTKYGAGETTAVKNVRVCYDRTANILGTVVTD